MARTEAEVARAEVLGAARALVHAFGSHDVDRYFSAFAADATFVFHNCAELIGSRSRYQEVWREWERDGFAVHGCRSLDQRVRLLTPDTAVFTHRVRTRVAGEPAELRERETIVFRREPAGGWLAVHEHLSVDPAPDDAAPDAATTDDRAPQATALEPTAPAADVLR
ncbi:nuclear transport factor 2 family protein [Planosporangium thailandense]|uniref:Nuclear transport factor 2 family protein n=1 Tax=Planosporangium thailandense TaxID=765197 RepID=A0ABX0Y5B2_9ACTN|nr:nuclear transport factor 2 family protein [Planosporangium thailandense]NJC72608.1 nuclear transport factor 2 family protein [Planosporangium thailandense]